MDCTKRVVVLIDMDCFYCQVEEKLNPDLKGKPLAVVQYNAWRGGGIIAVNYEARDQGVTRYMRGFDAKKICPNIALVKVPEVRGKADLTKYRDAGKEVADVLATFTPLLQRASVDEAYLDITELVNKRLTYQLSNLSANHLTNTFVVGYELQDFLEIAIQNKEFSESNLKLAVGGLITEEIRQEIYSKTGYRCSAGIAHNKILAKLVCSLHKPNKQTILPQEAVDDFFETMPIHKIKSLGGKFGQSLSEDLQISYMGQLKKFTEKELSQKYDEKTGNWLYNIARGIDLEPVTAKLISKSIACCKNFPGRSALITSESILYWLNELADELLERLEKDLKENNRKAKQLIVSFTQEVSKKDISSSRTQFLLTYERKKIVQTAFEVIKKFCLKKDGSFHLKFLGLSASNFEDIKKVREITSFFKTGQTEHQQYNKPDMVSESVDTAHTSKKHTMDENTDPEYSEIDNSIYHQLTQELVENIDDLIFFDDTHRVKNIEGILIQETAEYSVLSPKMQISKSNNLENSTSRQGLLPSFFKEYFYQETDTECFTKDAPSYNKIQNECNKNESLQEKPFEICIKCNKRIPSSELMSHKDYHFALKLVENKHNFSKTSDVVHKKSNTKRKSAQRKEGSKIPGNKDLLSFFNNVTDDTSELTETCKECNRKVKIDEVSSHMDYHVAKKIHVELNSTNTVKISKTKCTTTQNVKKNNPSIVSFFKRV